MIDIHAVKQLRRFRRWSLLTVFATIFLIWVGGWVRSTGSGMGCPDWPKCFDLWIPPTEEAQLPPDYLSHYVEKRQKKNARVAKMMAALGMTELAEKIQNDPSVLTPEPFNFYKTWTEYVNRLIGVLVGFFILLTFIFSLPTRRIDKRLFWLSLAGFIGVLFEGWLGSIVVSTNLMPALITIHMVVALLILMVLIAAALIAYTHEGKLTGSTVGKKTTVSTAIWVGIGVSALTLVQIVAGTQVRESVDVVSKTLGAAQRHLWVEALPSVYTFHKFFYYVLAAGLVFWVWILRGSLFFENKQIKRFSQVLLITLGAEILMGISMHRFAIPPILQPFHLLFGVLIFVETCTITSFLRNLKAQV